jgi:glycosyltransferase involved in cell wall biosynthesis
LEKGELQEILFVDDGSIDESKEIARQYPVRVISGTGLGPGAARNLGWRSATTELIWFIDSDCVAEPQTLEKLLTHMTDPEVTGVGGSYSNLYPESLIATLIHEEIIARHRQMQSEVNFLGGFNVLYRRTALEALGGYDESATNGPGAAGAEDCDLSFRAVQLGHRLRFEFNSLVGHHHPRRLGRYLSTQARHGRFRVQLYLRHREKMQGDSYANVIDYVQPPLAMMSLVMLPLLAMGGWVVFIPSTAIGLLLLAQLPMASRISASSFRMSTLYVPFGIIRAFARGIGMTQGLLSLKRSTLPTKPPVLDPHSRSTRLAAIGDRLNPEGSTTQAKNVLVCPFGDLNLLLYLFEQLEKQFPGTYAPTFLSFTPYDEAVYRSLKLDHVHIPPGQREEWFAKVDLEDVCRFTIELSRYHGILASDEYYWSSANHYGAKLSEVLRSKSFDHVVLFNGKMNLFIACLGNVAEQAGLHRLVFEQGLFRPRWITIDGRGVNAENSIQSLEQLLLDDHFDYQQRELYLDITSLFPIDRKSMPDYKRQPSVASMFRAYARSKLQPRRNIFLRDAENRDLLEAALLPRKARPRSKFVRQFDGFHPRSDLKYIFCPLQVETDTQILLHSPWISRMSELITVLCNVADQLHNRGIAVRVIFKRHPMSSCSVRISHPHADLIDNIPMPELFKRFKPLVVTINSTVGIEAIEAGLPVVTLGDAFFNLPGVVIGNCRDTESLTDLLSRYFRGEVPHAIEPGRQFIEALREKYQVLAFADLQS